VELLTVIFIAIGLSADAFAVSVVSGAIYKQINLKHAFRIAGFFGFFQGIMPLLGFCAGIPIQKYFEAFDHWIAFFVLFVIGVKMIIESFKMQHERADYDPSNIVILLVLAIATSIDALAVGFTLTLVTGHVFVSAVLIGVITFVLSLVGVYIGKRYGHFLEGKIEIAGGLCLIAIGVKILLAGLLW